MATDEVRVVVVDDLEDAATMLAYALERDGYVTRVAHDGIDALAVIVALTEKLCHGSFP